MSEKLYSKTETRKRLLVGRIRYEQLIESKILSSPIVLTDGARAVHTESQLIRAENNLKQKALQDCSPTIGRKMKPLSKKLVNEMR